MSLRKPPNRILGLTATREFLEEHTELMGFADAIGDAQDVATALGPLDGIRRVMPPHMADEERPDGVFDWLAAIAPELHDSINGLSMDHLELRDELVGLTRLPEDEAEALEKIKAFALHLRAHERREKAVLEAALEISEESGR